RSTHFVATGLEADTKRVQQRRVVVNDEDLGHGRYCFAAGSTVVSEKTKRAPPSGISSYQMCSPWASTNVLAMVRPSPARPPVSNCAKRSKMVSRLGVATPGPWSATESVT